MAANENTGKFGGTSGPWYQNHGESGPPWHIALFVLLGGLGFFLVLQAQSLVTRHTHNYRSYSDYIFLVLILSAIVGAFYGYVTIREAYQNTQSMMGWLKWWHWLWLIIFISGLVFRKRAASEGLEAPVDNAAMLRIGLVGLVGSILLCKLFLRQLDWLRSAFRGIMGLIMMFDLMALLSSIWSIYWQWTFYKAVEYGVDACLLATVLVLCQKSKDYKRFMDWTWLIYGVLLLNVWFGCIWDPLDALQKGGIYGQAGIGELGVWLQGVFPDVASNQIGEYAACIAAVALCRLLPLNRKRVDISWYGFVFVAAFITVIFAQTRSAFGGFCIALFFIFLMSDRVLQGASIVFAGVAAALMSSAGQVFYDYLKRGQSANQMDSLSSRVEWWQVALDKFANYPFTGLGMWAAARFGVLAKIGYTQTATIHSDWVEIIVGTGAWGLIPVLTLIIWTWYLLLRYTKTSKLSIYERQMAFEALAVLSVVFVRMFFMTDLSLHPPLHFFAVLGCAEFLRRKVKAREEGRDPEMMEELGLEG